MVKKIFGIGGMHCNSCALKIEEELKAKVDKISVSYADGKAEVEFNSDKISEQEIKEIIKKIGYDCEDCCDKEISSKTNKIGWAVLFLSVIGLLILIYFISKPYLPEINLANLGEKTSLILLFAAGILTGFHCIAMCGGFVVSYTTKNAIKGNKGFKQHLVYGGSKVVSYALIGGVIGLIGGIVAFSANLRGWIAILAGLFMIFYALGMFGIKFFRFFQFKGKTLSNIASKANKSEGKYTAPLITGLLNGLFIACGPLQAMYLYAAGTGSFFTGLTSLAVFGLGTLPVMLGFGSLATIISHKTTGKILKLSAIIVIMLGLIMLNRGLALTGSSFSYDSIKAKIIGASGASSSSVLNGVQEINMQVTSAGYSPNSFVLKKGVLTKWNIDVKELTSCNSELVASVYNIDLKLKSGIQTVEFTPDKAGTFTFTCGMGMLHGSFIVTEDGTATTQQVQTAKPATSSSCSMGSGCGCGM